MSGGVAKVARRTGDLAVRLPAPVVPLAAPVVPLGGPGVRLADAAVHFEGLGVHRTHAPDRSRP